MPLTATIVIATRNRRQELRRALESALAQTVEAEILVMDDASTDGTGAMVQADFPRVRLQRSETPCGYIVQRNRAAALATGDVLFSIDDDAEFSSAETVARTLREFGDARVGAVAMPYVEPAKGNQVLQCAPDAGVWVTGMFVGTAHAVRRDVFLRLGGYREPLVHQGEERDFCARLLDAGSVVRVGSAPPIVHHESPRRDFSRMDFYGRRNDILFAWQNVPGIRCGAHLLATTWNGVRFAFRCGRLRHQLGGLAAGYFEVMRRIHSRQPIAVAAYQLQRRLQKRGPLRLEAIEALLPPAAPSAQFELSAAH